jgi:DNA-binding IscR family transcriptional regulator
MAIATRFAIATHILTYIATQPPETTTSEWMAASIGANSVIVRNITAQLKRAGLVRTSQGVSGATLGKPLGDISLYDVYHAVETDKLLFSIHDNPSPNCPVGSKIKGVLSRNFLEAQREMEDNLAGKTMLDVIKDMKLKVRK